MQFVTPESLTKSFEDMSEQERDALLHGEYPGPVWPDHCLHPDGAYVCSFEYGEKCGTDQWRDVKIDLYVFQGAYGQEACLRFGKEPSDYYSPGETINLFRHGKLMRAYRMAADCLLVRGAMKWAEKVGA